MPNPPSPRQYLLLLVLASAGIFALCSLDPQLMEIAGIGPVDRWFMDTHTVLGSMEADWRGLDVYSYNAITMPHWYSHWWFWLAWAHPTQAATRWVGPLISGSAYLTALLVLRPRTRLELRWALIVLCSAPLLLGFHRANADLLLFTLLMLCVPLLSAPVRVWRILGAPLLIALTTGLKYYPATAGLVLLAVRPVRDRDLTLLVAIVLLILTGISVAPDLSHYTQNTPAPGFYTFGAPSLLLAAGLPRGIAPVGPLLLFILGGWALQRRVGLRDWSPPAGLRTEYLGFILAAAILTGCFVTTVNYVYRWIFLVGIMPFLCRLDVARTNPALHNLQKATRLFVFLALWIELPVVTALNVIGTTQDTIDRWEDWTMGCLQIVTWLLFACLGAWLVHFVASALRRGSEPPPGTT